MVEPHPQLNARLDPKKTIPALSWMHSEAGAGAAPGGGEEKDQKVRNRNSLEEEGQGSSGESDWGEEGVTSCQADRQELHISTNSSISCII